MGCPSKQQQGLGFSGESGDKDTNLPSALSQGLSLRGSQSPAFCLQTHSWEQFLTQKKEPNSALTYHGPSDGLPSPHGPATLSSQARHTLLAVGVGVWSLVPQIPLTPEM